jgi:hypothetical protein
MVPAGRAGVLHAAGGKPGIVTGAPSIYIARVRSFGLACLCPTGINLKTALNSDLQPPERAGARASMRFFRRREWRLAQ